MLKTPQHLEWLGPLMATFPDATVAFTLRDPVAVLQSAITMRASASRARTNVPSIHKPAFPYSLAVSKPVAG